MTNADHLAKLLREKASTRLMKRLDDMFKPILYSNKPSTVKIKVRGKGELELVDTVDTLHAIRQAIFAERIEREVADVTKEFVDAVEKVEDLRTDLENHNHG